MNLIIPFLAQTNSYLPKGLVGNFIQNIAKLVIAQWLNFSNMQEATKSIQCYQLGIKCQIDEINNAQILESCYVLKILQKRTFKGTASISCQVPHTLQQLLTPFQISQFSHCFWRALFQRHWRVYWSQVCLALPTAVWWWYQHTPDCPAQKS